MSWRRGMQYTEFECISFRNKQEDQTSLNQKTRSLITFRAIDLNSHLFLFRGLDLLVQPRIATVRRISLYECASTHATFIAFSELYIAAPENSR